MYWTTLEISAPRCALMCYPSSNITYCIACLLCIGVVLLNKFNSIGPLPVVCFYCWSLGGSSSKSGIRLVHDVNKASQ